MIECKRFYIRKLESSDIPEVTKLLRGKNAVYLSDKFGENVVQEELKTIFEDILNSTIESRMIFLVYLNKSNKLIGYFAITRINWILRNCEISAYIDENYQGVGYGQLVSDKMIAYCFDELNLRKLNVKIRSDNVNVPYRKKGQLLQDGYYDSENKHDFYYFEIFKDTWVPSPLTIGE